ncbi:MAG: GntR family transcriptional regulator [Bacillota bacterium]|nr:GntR family transcriptional regulator [Bacillota bacterium]
MMKIDKNSSVPLYAQLKDLLSERIEDGSYGPGSQIPTELALCEELDLSRPTVRKAISELVNEGLLIIRKGKGTFVREAPDHLILPNFSPFRFCFLAGQSLEDKRFIDYEKIDTLPAEYESAFAGNSGDGSGRYFEVIWTEGEPRKSFAYCRSFIPAAMFPTLAEDIRARRRMIDITANRYPLLPHRADWRLHVRPASHEEARALDISRGTPVLVVESACHSRSGNVSEFSVAVLRADRCVLQFEPVSQRRD